MSNRKRDGQSGNESGNTRPPRCEECGAEATSKTRGWRALLTGEPGVDEHDFVTIFCPACAEREFGTPPPD